MKLSLSAGLAGRGRAPLITGLLAGAVVGVTAMAGFGYAHAALTETPKINACVGTGGALRLAAKDGSCKPGETPLQWNVEGPAGLQGAPGVFSGDFRSPNGNFLLHVGDDGIRLASPTSSVRIDASSVSIEGAATTDIKGGIVRLNGGCRPLVRSGDLTLPAVAPGATQGAPMAIPPIPLGNGSSTVFAC